MSETSTLISCTGKITRAELTKLPTPSATHVPIPHTAIVENLVESLSHRRIGVVDEEFAVSSDAMEMFGVLDLETSFEGCPFFLSFNRTPSCTEAPCASGCRWGSGLLSSTFPIRTHRLSSILFDCLTQQLPNCPKYAIFPRGIQQVCSSFFASCLPIALRFQCTVQGL